MKHLADARRWARSAALVAALAALTAPVVIAAPVMDGVRDAEYTQIATSEKDNLLVREASSINDNTTPLTHVLDLTNFYAANSRGALFLYIEMPYLDLNTVYGEWAVAMHLGGANDAIEITNSPGDPYGASVSYNYSPQVNVVLKSNMRGFKAVSDGDQGWAELARSNPTSDGYAWGLGNFLGNTQWVTDTANNLIHGYGNSGGEVVYKGASGTEPGAIEVMIPLALFGAGDPTNITAPKIGDVLKMQVYDNFRVDNPRPTTYPRGPIDAVPFESDMWIDPTHGTLSQYASYTLKEPTTLELGLVSATDMTHLAVSFSNSLGEGAATAANYTLTNLETSTAVPVTEAVVDPTDNTKVTLTVPDLPKGTHLRLTVENVKTPSGTVIAAGRNSLDFTTLTAVVFHLHDPLGLIAAIPPDQPFKVTLTGSLIGWASSDTGAGEIQLTKVDNETPPHYMSDPVWVAPGRIYYKYRVPGALVANVWDYLNYAQPDRQFDVPDSKGVVEVTDYAVNDQTPGANVAVTFTLVDNENRAAGRDVYIAGKFDNWTYDELSGDKMTKTGTNTYSITLNVPQYYTAYRYYVWVPDPANPGTNKADTGVFTTDDIFRRIVGTGTPPTLSVVDIIGRPPTVRILKVAAGLEAAPTPAAGSDFKALDKDGDNSITVLDAIKSLKP